MVMTGSLSPLRMKTGAGDPLSVPPASTLDQEGTGTDTRWLTGNK